MNLKELEKSITPETAAVLVQSPNFFGTIEDVEAIATIAHKHGAMLVVSIAEAVSLGIVEPPREADVIAMEAQSFARCRAGSSARRSISRAGGDLC